MDALDTTLRLVEARRDKIISRFGLGDTEQGVDFAEALYDSHIQIFTRKIEEAKHNRGIRGAVRQLMVLPAETMTAIALNSAISCLHHSNPLLSVTLRHLGTDAYMECYGRALADYNQKEADRLEALVKYKHGSLKHRRAALRGYARKIGDFSYEPWLDKERMACGKFLLEALLEGPAFRLNDEHLLELTPEALGQLEDISSEIVLRRLVGVPMTGESLSWEESTLHISTPEGIPLPYSLVRSYQKPVRAHVDRAVRSGQAGRVLEALNAIQSVRWRINEPILRLVQHCYDHDIPVSGLPSRKDIQKPPRPEGFEEMTSDQRYVWRRKAAEINTANRGFIGQRIVLSRDLTTAEYLLAQSDFWIPHNIDYRGRVYGIPHFQFQRQDYVRAMFMFAEGQLVDASGLYWLKVHTANCGDFGKVSKQSFDDRVWWIEDNIERLIATANAPLEDLWWTEADKPFLFVAACMALRDALEGKPVHVPVSFDGSCSGLQHLSAMSRCEETSRLVNLCNTKKPADIYQTVADAVKLKVEADLTSERVLSFRESEETVRVIPVSTLARMVLDYGVTRSLVKRNVMTYSYSSKRSGMQDQIMEDTMRPKQLDVLAGELSHHPFGDDGGFAAARYLSEITYNAIVETVKRPAVVMKYLQDIARVMSHHGHPVVWTTPLGLPVMLRCPNIDTTQVELFLHDRGINLRLKPRTNHETGGMNKKNATQAVAPSFVHAYDACHLMMVVLRAKREGINSLALVHDSFGCLPNEAQRFREIIKETFVELYANNDPLEQIRQENCVHLVTHGHQLPDLPTKGNLHIEEVLHADYAFA